MNTLAQRLNVDRLLLQAPMAGSQGSALALAVCAAGGIGALPAALLSPEVLTQELRALAGGTNRPWNVNFFCHTPPEPDAARETAWRRVLAPFYAEAGLDINGVAAGAGRVPFSHAVADLVEPFRPPIVSFHFGLPAPDLLAIVATVKIPVIAAGGIGSAPGVRAALALGAAGVQVGTAYLCSDEATTSAIHRAALAVQRPTGARHRQPRDARARPAEPGRARLPHRHRRHRPPACLLGGQGQWRLFPAVVGSERRRLPVVAGWRDHPATAARLWRLSDGLNPSTVR